MLGAIQQIRRCPLPLAVAAATLLLPAALTAQAGDFTWRGRVAAGQTLEIRGVQGDIRAEFTTGDQIEVVAHKTARRDDPTAVGVEVVPHAAGVTICAVYPTPSDAGRPNACGPEGSYTMNTKNNDVHVDFVVRVPAGVRLKAVSVTGDVQARQLRSYVDARTVTGDVTLSTSDQARASTVTGDVDVTIGMVGSSGALEFKTVTGDVAVQLPAGAGARLRLRTVTGAFRSDFPVTVDGTMSPRRMDGTIGNGGAEIRLETVTGEIRLRRAD